jgi:hypothetical protein
MKKIPVEYLSGLTNAEQAEIKRIWKLHNPLMEALYKVLNTKLEQEQTITMREYDLPNWPYRRAAKDGYIQALQIIINLLPDQR